MFVDQWAANRGAFPRGIDLIFAGEGALAALPRTTRISKGRREPCMLPSRAVKPPFAMRTNCWPTAAVAIARVPAIGLDQIVEQLALAVDRVMAEGSLYDTELAALAVKQARGDMIEAIFLVRAYRTTLPRFGYTKPVETSRMAIERRISATFKDLPGGQLLGPTFDYTHRLLDPELAEDGVGRTARTPR